MKLSEMYFYTLKEMPKDAQMISHKLLLKAGYIRPLASGVYSYLPLFVKVMENVRSIINEEMQAIGGQEFLLPIITPSEIWQETGRWEDFGDEMFRLKDRKNRLFALSPTHEEIITDLARKSIKSYKELPQIWYQIQIKFRDEPRPRSGLLRVRQFEMKDSYSLDTDFDGLDIAYNKHREAYIKIFNRCSIDFTIVEAASGLMGGKKSEEYMAISDSGEDTVVICNKCGASWNTEVAVPKSDYEEYEDRELEKVHTPVDGDIKSIKDFLKVDEKQLMKSILFIVNSEPVFVIISGDRDIDENKLDLIFGDKYRYANDDEIIKYTNAPKGYISPINLNIKVYADNLLKGRKGLISGANAKHYHYTGINVERDIKNIKFANIIKIRENDKCPECGGELKIKKSIEIGHIFQLGTKYSKSLNANYTDKDGKEKPIVMGSYGIGLGRIISTVIEQHHDDNGIIWPIVLAPYKIIILPLSNKNEEVINFAEHIYKELKKDYDVLLDDRQISAGNKFKDADLIGIPIKIVIGKHYIENKNIEVSLRKNNEKILINENQIIEKIKNLILKLKEEENVK